MAQYPIPVLLLSPSGSRDRAGEVMPDVGANIEIVDGRWGPAWRATSSTDAAVTVPASSYLGDGLSQMTMIARSRMGTSGDASLMAAGDASVSFLEVVGRPSSESVQGFITYFGSPLPLWSVAYDDMREPPDHTITTASRISGDWLLDLWANGASNQYNASSLNLSPVSGGLIGFGDRLQAIGAECESIILYDTALPYDEIARIMDMDDEWTWWNLTGQQPPRPPIITNVIQPGTGAYMAHTVLWRADRYGTRIERLPIDVPVQGTITDNEDADVKRKLSLEVNNPDILTPFRDYLIPEITLTDAAGTSQTQPFGLYMVTPPNTSLTGSRYSGTIEGLDITWRLAQDTLDHGYIVDPDVDHGSAARDIALSGDFPAYQLHIPDTGTSSPTEIVIDPGTSRLSAIGTILQTANWYVPWMDSQGIVMTAPTQNLQTARGSRRYSSDDGSNVTIVPPMDERPNWDRLRNKVTVRNIAPEREPIYVTAEITNADHPLYHEPGNDETFPMWLAETVDDPQVADETAALRRAENLLSSGASYYRPLTIQTVLDMTADAHDVIELDVRRHGKTYDGLWFRRAWQVNLRGVTALTTSEIWRVENWQ